IHEYLLTKVPPVPQPGKPALSDEHSAITQPEEAARPTEHEEAIQNHERNEIVEEPPRHVPERPILGHEFHQPQPLAQRRRVQRCLLTWATVGLMMAIAILLLKKLMKSSGYGAIHEYMQSKVPPIPQPGKPELSYEHSAIRQPEEEARPTEHEEAIHNHEGNEIIEEPPRHAPERLISGHEFHQQQPLVRQSLRSSCLVFVMFGNFICSAKGFGHLVYLISAYMYCLRVHIGSPSQGQMNVD
ncbi:hypothetical protein CRG98_001348, partial [Punica granatum]